MVELLVAMAIVGILAAIATPLYISYVQQSRRSDAWQALSAAQTQMEQCYAQYFAYNSASCSITASSPSGYYQVQIASATTVSSYTLTASPASGSAQTRDTSCSTLSVTSTGLKTAANSAGSDTSSTCWPS
ncbi:prepilin-type N-terminal cleavage/methylation domain-containing protein [Chromobacterium sp. IIBBL 290-4]|nr:type IV pilin protein [Chromobacterium sp. IIBBL 290-4]UTH76168.1 prepilin-type N-terminal cleavage/methylation domain-containing protein [Chromobacterium sp. IIBBL 290-4]